MVSELSLSLGARSSEIREMGRLRRSAGLHALSCRFGSLPLSVSPARLPSLLPLRNKLEFSGWFSKSAIALAYSALSHFANCVQREDFKEDNVANRQRQWTELCRVDRKQMGSWRNDVRIWSGGLRRGIVHVVDTTLGKDQAFTWLMDDTRKIEVCRQFGKAKRTRSAPVPMANLLGCTSL